MTIKLIQKFTEKMFFYSGKALIKIQKKKIRTNEKEISFTG